MPYFAKVNTAFFSLDGNLVLSAAADKTAKIWCAHTGAAGHPSPIMEDSNS